jgi:hypothetical protein
MFFDVLRIYAKKQPLSLILFCHLTIEGFFLQPLLECVRIRIRNTAWFQPTV